MEKPDSVKYVFGIEDNTGMNAECSDIKFETDKLPTTDQEIDEFNYELLQKAKVVFRKLERNKNRRFA